MDLRTLLRFLRSSLPLILATTVVATLVAVVVSVVLPRTYAASVKVIVGSSIAGTVTDYNELQTALQLANTYAISAQTTTTAQKVIASMSLPTTPERFIRDLSTEVDRESPILTVTYRAPSAQQAADVANAVAAQLIATQGANAGQDVVTRQLLAQIADVSAQIAELEQRAVVLSEIPQPNQVQVDQLDDAEAHIVALRATLADLTASTAPAARSNAMSVLDPAVPPLEPESPRPLINGIIGVVAGLAAGVLLALTRRSLDDTIQDEEDARRAVGVPVLASIARLPATADAPIRRLAMFSAPRSLAAEAFRTLRTSLEFSLPAGEPGVFLVASDGSGDGKSIVAANVALAFAQAGRRTILVDANLRAPALHDLFQTTNERGLTSLLQEPPLSVDAVAYHETHSGLTVITSGPLPEDPSEQLGSRRAAEVIDQLRERADVIVLDSAAAGSYTDAVLLASLVDAVLLVVATGRTRQSRLPRTIEAFGRVGAKVVGVAVNRLAGRARGQVAKKGVTPPIAVRAEPPPAT